RGLRSRTTGALTARSRRLATRGLLAATRGCLRRRRSLRAGSPTGRHLATGGCLAASADTTGCAGGRGDTLACVRDLLALLDLLLTLLIRLQIGRASCRERVKCCLD